MIFDDVVSCYAMNLWMKFISVLDVTIRDYNQPVTAWYPVFGSAIGDESVFMNTMEEDADALVPCMANFN